MRRVLLYPVLLALLFVLGAAASQALPLRYEASWQSNIAAGSHGYGVGLLPTGSTTEVADWLTPNAPGALAVGICTYDPPTKDIFNAERNIEGRPQQEISLHWDGQEVSRRLSPVALLGPIDVRLTVAFVVGGANISVRVGRTAVYDRIFVPGVMPYAARIASGVSTGADIRALKLQSAGAAPDYGAPLRVRAMDQQINDAAHHTLTAEANLPQDTSGYGRVICTLTLAATPAGLDKWDRVASVYLYDDRGERFEILRYITPYHKAYQWTADVTDLLPLLTGHKKIEAFCETYGEGWLVSIDFDYYPGPLKSRPYRVVNLWNTIAVIGEADKPIVDQLPAKTIPIDAGADRTAVRLCVTGHGQAPNTDDAAEFLPLWRKLTVGGAAFTDTLWKTDNYLNPCRPQGGTWKFDRAGWGPGTVVTPWTVDVTRSVKRGRDATFVYEIQPFVNKTPDHGNPARHVIASQVIFYRDSR